MRPTRSSRARGMTLVEMIVVIAITGIVAAAVAVFIQRPVEGYTGATRRAELTDIADTALRRISRDLRTALPNSVRVDATGKFIEYLQTSGGGRYRADVDSAGAGDTLDFTNPAGDQTFDVIGPMPAFAGGESVVIYNLASSGAIANAYTSDNSALVDVAGSTATNVRLQSPKVFPFASPGKRFHVVQYPVTYGCDLGTGRLTRYWGYTIDVNQATPPAGGSSAVLASRVTDCGFTYTPGGATARGSVVSLVLQIERNNEKVRLFQQAHVPNVP